MGESEKEGGRGCSHVADSGAAFMAFPTEGSQFCIAHAAPETRAIASQRMREAKTPASSLQRRRASRRP